VRGVSVKHDGGDGGGGPGAGDTLLIRRRK